MRFPTQIETLLNLDGPLLKLTGVRGRHASRHQEAAARFPPLLKPYLTLLNLDGPLLKLTGVRGRHASRHQEAAAFYEAGYALQRGNLSCAYHHGIALCRGKSFAAAAAVYEVCGPTPHTAAPAHPHQQSMVTRLAASLRTDNSPQKGSSTTVSRSEDIRLI